MLNYIETESVNWNFFKYGRIGKHPVQSLYTTVLCDYKNSSTIYIGVHWCRLDSTHVYTCNTIATVTILVCEV